jgi:hypothetical protein
MKWSKFIRHLFTPQETNNFKSKALHLDSLTVYLLFVLLVTVVFKQISFGDSNVLGYATDITVSKLYELTNAERQKAGLDPLAYNDKLQTAAQKKAQHMFEKNFWAHYGPDGSTPWDFILGAGYEYKYAGENLAKNFLFSDNVVDAWMNSKGHRDNILKKEYTDVGFAIANGVLNGEPTTLVVQMFGTPLHPSDTPPSYSPPAEHSVPVVQSEQSNNVNTNPAPPQPAQEAPVPEQVQKPAINLLPSFSVIQIGFIVFLAFVLLLDLYFALKMDVIRISGKSIAHLMFLGFILLGSLMILRGGGL